MLLKLVPSKCLIVHVLVMLQATGIMSNPIIVLTASIHRPMQTVTGSRLILCQSLWYSRTIAPSSLINTRNIIYAWLPQYVYMLYTCTKYSYMCMLTVHILAEWDSDCAGECLSFCQQEWRDFFLQTIFVSYHTCACTCVQSLFNSVAFQTSTRATAVQLQLFCLVSHACDDGYTITLLVMHVSFSVAEEDMRLMLVSSSPLTTSVNAITWQDYIGTYTSSYSWYM